MFKLMKSLFLITAVFLFCIDPVHAAKVSCEGTPDSSNNCPIESNDSRLVSFPGGGVLAKYERKTTNDTLTNTESGKTLIMAPATGAAVTITLPSATIDSLGMEFTFVADDVGAVATGVKYFWIDPSANDTIIFQSTQGAASTMSRGDKLKSNGVTGDSIHLVVGQELIWTVDNVRGTWVDDN